MRIRKLAAAVAAVALGFAGAITTQAEAAETDVYATPGVHLVNGRYWKTTCANYSPSVIRCTTDIFATKVFLEAGRWYKQNTWAFNNLSYLPSPRSQWATNPLGNTGRWVSDEGRQWRTECDTPATGTGACRNYIVATVASETGGVVKTETKEIFNSMVRFSSSTIPAVTVIPASAPVRSDVPVDGPKLPIGVAPAPKPAPARPAPVTPTPPATSVAPSGSSCPSGYPIKGNHSSSGEYIYHVPGQRHYTITKPEECFSSESAARAAGYRKSKV